MSIKLCLAGEGAMGLNHIKALKTLEVGMISMRVSFRRRV